MSPQLYVANRSTYAQAAELIARFGDDAGFEAAARADRSRDVGNVVTYCHWRQIERLIVALSGEAVTGTVH